MTMSRLPRRIAEALGGTDPESLSEESLHALVGLREAQDLDVKQDVYGNGESDRRELAADVAAFANAQGGVLLIGAKEQEEVVTALSPVRTMGEELRIKQIIANSCAPPIRTSVSIVPSAMNPELGYVIVVVPPSPLAPHAVVKNGDLRYCVRDGSGKRYMGESEVADRYRSRVAMASSRLDRLDALHSGVHRRTSADSDVVWLELTMVPAVAGRMDITRQERDRVHAWAQQSLLLAPPAANLESLTVSVLTGHRRVIMGDWKLREVGAAEYAVGEFHADGSSSFALAVGWDWSRQEGVGEKLLTVGDEGFSWAVSALLLLGGRFIERSGGGGDVSVMASIRSRHPFGLGHSRFMGFGERLPGTHTVAEVEQMTQSLSLDDLVVPSSDLLAASYIVASDLMSALGQPETLQIDGDGAVQWKYVGLNWRPRLAPWLDAYSIPVLGRE